MALQWETALCLLRICSQILIRLWEEQRPPSALLTGRRHRATDPPWSREALRGEAQRTDGGSWGKGAIDRRGVPKNLVFTPRTLELLMQVFDRSRMAIWESIDELRCVCFLQLFPLLPIFPNSILLKKKKPSNFLDFLIS